MVIFPLYRENTHIYRMSAVLIRNLHDLLSVLCWDSQDKWTSSMGVLGSAPRIGFCEYPRY